MKALVIGCGSIGGRHIHNLTKFDNIESISIFTKNKHCLDNIEVKNRLEIVNSLSNVKVDFAIVANETHQHLNTAILLAENGINLFIEKPLSHGLKKVDILRKIVKRKNIKISIGYNLRFLGAVEFIKEQLSNGIMGDLYFAKIEVGQFLPLWRPGRNYRDSYSANRIKGGGVDLDLSHEIDYMRYLFGDPFSWKVLKSKVSKLEINSDDLFEGIYLFTDKFICNVHMDYLQIKEKREIRIVGSNRMLICDFVGKFIKLIGNNSETTVNDENMFDVGKTYIDELKHFIESIERDIKPRVTLEDGIRVLRLLEYGNV